MVPRERAGDLLPKTWSVFVFKSFQSIVIGLWKKSKFDKNCIFSKKPLCLRPYPHLMSRDIEKYLKQKL